MKFDGRLLLQNFVFMLLQTVRAEIGHFWHVTDLRYDVNYPMHFGQRSHSGNGILDNSMVGYQRGNSGPGPGGGTMPPGPFGDFNHDSPWALLNSAAAAMKTIAKDVEFVLWTGDGPGLGQEGHVAARNMTGLLGHVFPESFVFPLTGPGSRHSDRLYKTAFELWKMWLPEETMQTFLHGGYYIIQQKRWKIRIIALNTNLWSDFSSVNSASVIPAASRSRGENAERRGHKINRGDTWSSYDSRLENYHSVPDGYGGRVSGRESREGRFREREVHLDPSGQWQWLDEELAKAKRDGKLVYLVGNTAPGVDERLQHLPLQNGLHEIHNKRFVEMIRKYHSIIAGQFFGHRHSDTFRVIYNATGERQAVSWQLIAPSVSPRRTQSGLNNPAIRLYSFERKTGKILDYAQYYLDLPDANKQGKAEWKLEYNFTQYYDLSITPKNLDELAESFATPQGYSWFEKYFVSNSVRIYNSPVEASCSTTCLQTHYCAITRVDYSEYWSCLKTAAAALSASSAPRLHHSSVSSTLLVVSLVLLSVYRNAPQRTS